MQVSVRIRGNIYQCTMVLFQSFRFSNVCFWSYLSRTVLEIFLSIGLFLIYWCWGMPNLERNIDCDVHGLKWVDCRIYKCLENSRTISELYLFWLWNSFLFLIKFISQRPYKRKQATTCTMYFRHMCVLPNHQFYFYILTVSSGLLCIYILCNLYNLVKLTIWTKLCNVCLYLLQCWIVWPQMGLMYRVIRKYRDEMNICTFEPRKPFINHENFLNVYFDR